MTPHKKIFNWLKTPGHHPFDGMLRGIIVALACCAVGLRDIKDLLGKLLSKLGMEKGGVSDTNIWEVLPRIEPEQFRTVVTKQIKSDLNAKHITNDIFPGGVITIDGKGVGSGMGIASNSNVRQSVCDAKGTKFWNAFASRGGAGG